MNRLKVLSFILISLFFTNAIFSQYCDAEGAVGTTADWIKKVRLYSLIKTSDQSAYSDFTNLNVELAQNASYDLFVHLNFGFELDTAYVWIDFNQDEIFDNSELVLNGPFGEPDFISEANITVPGNAVLGQTRMRVRAIYSADPIPDPSCGSYFGEVEDYSVTIIDDDCTMVGQPCNDGMDCSINDIIDANCNCVGEIEDDDLDGVCNEDDLCPGADDNLDLDNNGIPDILEGYCEAGGSPGTGADYITRVRLYDINNYSAKSSYSDFTDISTDLVQDGTYDLSIHIEAFFDLDAAYGWIDYNQNNKFEQSEAIDMSDFMGGTISTGTVQVPNDATLGETRMRVRCIYGTDIENASCGSHFGEVEDYTVNIIPNDCTTVGEPCDDGIDCSINDAIDQNCNCVGEIQDDDYDGVCNEDDNCPGEDDFADINENGVIDCEDYCLALGAENTGDDFIEQVVILNDAFTQVYSNESQQSFYSDFSDIQFILEPGQGYYLGIILNEVFEGDTPQAWIDYDQSVTFEGAEFIDMQPYVDDSISLGFFVTPLDFPLQELRLRVRNIFSETGDIDPCGTYPGEVEDYTVIIDEEISVNQLTKEVFTVFPNPANDVINIVISNSNYYGKLTVYNTLGKLVHYQHVGQNNILLNCSSWPKGLYYISYSLDENSLSKIQKVVIQ